MSLTVKLRELLKHGALTVDAIAEMLGAKATSVRTILYRGSETFAHIGTEKGDSAKWGLAVTKSTHFS